MFSHDLRIVFLYTALVMFIVRSFYHLSVQPFLSAHLLGAWPMHSVLAILHVIFRGTRLSLHCAAPSIICYLEWLFVIGAYILSRLSCTRSQYITIDNNCVPCRDHLLFVVLVTLAKQSVKMLFIILLVSLGYFVYFIMPPRKRTAKEIPAPAMPSIRPNKRADGDDFDQTMCLSLPQQLSQKAKIPAKLPKL